MTERRVVRERVRILTYNLAPRWQVLTEYLDGEERVGYGDTIAEALDDRVTVAMWYGKEPIVYGDSTYGRKLFA